MFSAYVPYLESVRDQIETTLWPREKGGFGEKSAMYSREVLARLITQVKEAPLMRQRALKAYEALINEFAEAFADDLPFLRELETHVSWTPDYDRAELLLQEAVGKLLARDDVCSKKLVEKIAEVEQELLLQFDRATEHELLRQQRETTGAEGLSDEQTLRLESLLRKSFPEERHLRVGASRLIPGGFSKQTVFVELHNCSDLPDTVVLRIDKSLNVLGAAVADEYPIVQCMFEAEVPVAKPLHLECGTEVLGSPFAIFSRIEGSNIGDVFDVLEPSRTFGITLAQALAKLHTVSPERVGDQVLGAKQSVKDRVLGEIISCEASWRSCKDPSIAVEMAYGWLKKNIHLAGERRSVIHRDIGCHNLLVKDGQVTGIVDWEVAAIGDPTQDLAIAYQTVVQVMPWDEFIAEYVRAGGFVPMKEQIDFYRLWRQTWLLWTLVQGKAALKGGLAGDIGMTFAVVCKSHQVALQLQEILVKVASQD